MQIATACPEEHAELLALMEEALRPQGGPTRVWDDYPVALGRGNREGLWVAREEGGVAAGLCVLVRPFRTSWGELPIAAIGSVATASARQGRGLSRALQEAALSRLRAEGVPLAVLWSDHPEYYGGRGFLPAGVEYHADLSAWRPRAQTGADEVRVRPYRAPDCAAVAALYEGHELHTRRAPEDAACLYAMPGTRGLVAVAPDGRPAGYAFCGKGLDFARYVLDWQAAPAVLGPLLAAAKHDLGAQWVLLPQSTEGAAAQLAREGAAVTARPSGLWAVVRPDVLAAAGTAATGRVPAPAAQGRPEAWLGAVDAAGSPQAGPLRVAVWGFDSV